MATALMEFTDKFRGNLLTVLRQAMRRNPKMFLPVRVAGGGGNIAGDESPEEKLWRLVVLYALGIPGRRGEWSEPPLYYADGVFTSRWGHVEGRLVSDLLVPLAGDVAARNPMEFIRIVHEAAEIGVRHGVLLALVGAAKAGQGRVVREVNPYILNTPSMAADLLRYWRLKGNREGRYPHSLTDLIAAAFPQWDTYQLRKHYGAGKYTVRAMLRLSHPRPLTGDMARLWGRIVESGKDALPVPETWEVLISEAGDDRQARVAAWMQLMRRGKLPVKATLRNLRNMCEDGVPLDLIADYIRTRRPRYLDLETVVKAVDAVPELQGALLDLFARGRRRSLAGHTDIIVDVSGSMGSAEATMSALRSDRRIVRAISVAYGLLVAAESARLFFTAGDDRTREMAIVQYQLPRRIPTPSELMGAAMASRRELGIGGIFTRQVLYWLMNEAPRPPRPVTRTIIISDSQDMDDVENNAPYPHWGEHMYEINVAGYTNVHITNRHPLFIALDTGAKIDPVPFIRANELSGGRRV